MGIRDAAGRDVRFRLRLALVMLLLAVPVALAQEGPTVEEYLAKQAGPEAKLLPPGEFKIDGIKVYCGKRPTIVDPEFDSWGGALPGFLIWNPKLTKKLSKVVKLYAYSHECGHQFVGASEEDADCFAIRRGRRYGWLDEKGMEEICDFISNLKADDSHKGGPERCAYMRKCFKEYGPNQPVR